MKTAELSSSETSFNLYVAMVPKGGRRPLKKTFLGLKIKSFNLSESFKSVAEGILEVHEEVHLVTMGPPTGLDRVKSLLGKSFVKTSFLTVYFSLSLASHAEEIAQHSVPDGYANTSK